MKSRIYNNTDGAKDMGSYLELSLQQFLIQMPQYAHTILNTPIDVNDTNYIVRFQFLKNGRPRIEVGYPEDVEWKIGEPDKSKKPGYPSTMGAFDDKGEWKEFTAEDFEENKK